MFDYLNPFEYEAANKLKLGQILDFYIEDFNYSRFVRSKRNIYLVGERGTGKTMTLMFNSLPVQIKRAEKLFQKIALDLVCVYVPCNTPLTHKTEYALLEDFQGSVISEHFLVMSIMYAVADALSQVSDLLENSEASTLKRELEFLLDIQIPSEVGLLEGLKLVFQKENIDAQGALNNKKLDAFYENARSFSTGVMPLLSSFRKVSRLKDSHFVIMLDDAHDLNSQQVRVLNSWIAYRDNSLFSFKVATTKVGRPDFIAASGGAILEGHDFTMVDMELPYQNRYSNFGKLAREIVQRRLENVGLHNISPEGFFPINPEFEKELNRCEESVRKEAELRFSQGTSKQIDDYVYKNARASYFRERSARANRPPYSGFDILVHISTGVIRNLLEPCYWMYDKVVSQHRALGAREFTVREIPPSVQTEILLERSKKKWEWIRDGFDKSIEGCSRKDAERLYNLFDNLAVLFRERLLRHKSEPRAIAFTVSETKHSNYDDLILLLGIARRAQILYTYTSSAKDSGKREVYYIPNRILWPDRGLDPHGQHARVSIRASELWAAANGKEISFTPDDEPGNSETAREMELF